MVRFLIALLVVLPAWAQVEIMELDFDLGARSIQNSENNRLRTQARVRVGFAIDVDGAFELVGFAATGPNFDSTWASVTDTQKETEGHAVVFRNLYVRKSFNDVKVEAGALEPMPTPGDGGQAPNGWVDGVRVEVNGRVGRFKVVAGSLGDFDQPNLLRRKFDANFIEIEMEERLFADLMSQTGIQNYNGEFYLRQNISSKLRILGGKVLNLFAAALVDLKRGAITGDVGVEFDVLETLLDQYKGRLNLRLFYIHVDERSPDRRPMLSTFNTFGHQFSLHVSGKIDRDGKLNWYHRSSFGDRSRHDTGVTLRIPFR